MYEKFLVTTYADVGAVTIFVWDYLLTIHLEVDYMWSSKWSLVKILFILTRYLPIVDLTIMLFFDLNPGASTDACHILFSVAGWFMSIGIIVAEMIVVLRTWAIWERGKRIGYVLVAVSIGCLVPSLVLQSISFNSAGLETNVGVIRTDGIVFFDYTMIMVLEICITLLNVIISNAIFPLSEILPNDLLLLQRVMHSCLSARVLLHLRKAHKVEISEIELSELGTT
ncbi:hypothetical protein NLI96_g7507 [Meripilus lineatus]|uniref:DUF6533 domain-containing protein n=1 Tax=Meripilus lineatus TaxID=2056292 RepID=A0AAD5YBZ9_9APHY|nr:hypothetical protein NLI96_g7507 [Physisporinus lineatus]